MTQGKANTHRPRTGTLSIAITGSGGSGVVTAGQILLSAAGRAGLYGLMSRSSGPQIRGGESAALLRIGDTPLQGPADVFDALIAFDWLNYSRFADEIPLDNHSLVITDPSADAVAEKVATGEATVIEVPLQQIAREVPAGRANMVGVGVLARTLGISLKNVISAAESALSGKSDQTRSAARDCIARGFRRDPENIGGIPWSTADQNSPHLWNISGNEACGLGALRAGVRFVAAYPITPATEMLEWLAPRLEQVGGVLLQAEDELASVNMVIGASFGGIPALTATSGPGLSLMMEGLGLAVASETPMVVVNVMRGGPSTGIPTKSEQSDLNLALHGFHGDAPHLVMAPLSIEDCAPTTEWAVGLAERLQTVAIVLSDQSLGQSRAVIDPSPASDGKVERKTPSTPADDYRRYALEEGGISSAATPGMRECMYTAEGLEHTETGVPSSAASDHAIQLEKRRRKIEAYEYGGRAIEIRGEGDNLILAWGSTSGVAFESARRLSEQGMPTRVVAVRLLAPLQVEVLKKALAGARRVIVVEQNDSGQFFQHLCAHRVLPADARSLAHPGPLPIRPAEIVGLMRNGD